MSKVIILLTFYIFMYNANYYTKKIRITNNHGIQFNIRCQIAHALNLKGGDKVSIKWSITDRTITIQKVCDSWVSFTCLSGTIYGDKNNSKRIYIPQKVCRDIDLRNGDTVKISTFDDKLIIEKVVLQTYL